MSYSLDVNILLYASNAEGPEHTRALQFLRDCAGGGELLCIAWITVMSYLRMATHPRLFAAPLSPADAERNVSALISRPHVRMLAEEDGFWDTYQALTGTVPVRGNLVPDAHLAAILRQHGVAKIYTRDRDFRKFDFLDVRDPLEGFAKP